MSSAPATTSRLTGASDPQCLRRLEAFAPLGLSRAFQISAAEDRQRAPFPLARGSLADGRLPHIALVGRGPPEFRLHRKPVCPDARRFPVVYPQRLRPPWNLGQDLEVAGNQVDGPRGSGHLLGARHQKGQTEIATTDGLGRYDMPLPSLHAAGSVVSPWRCTLARDLGFSLEHGACRRGRAPSGAHPLHGGAGSLRLAAGRCAADPWHIHGADGRRQPSAPGSRMALLSSRWRAWGGVIEGLATLVKTRTPMSRRYINFAYRSGPSACWSPCPIGALITYGISWRVVIAPWRLRFFGAAAAPTARK